MNSDAVPGQFITFILPLRLRQNRTVSGSGLTHSRCGAPAGLLSLTKFLSAALDRVRTHEGRELRGPHPGQLVFRIAPAIPGLPSCISARGEPSTTI